MRLSAKFPVPSEIALLYEFVNSLDLRRYVEQGVPHAASDELATPARLEAWLRARGLLDATARLDADDHRAALELREALRAFLELTPDRRATDKDAAARLNTAAARYPLALHVSDAGGIAMRGARVPPAGGLADVLAELHRLSVEARLDRLKLCDSPECRWMFYDRSKPGNRRWCSSVLCGNRHKTRGYRARRAAPASND